LQLTKVRIYPNPATDIIHFNTDVDQISIFNAIGDKMRSEYDTNKLSMTGLKSGIYFVETLLGDDRQTQKVIKQ